MTQEDKKLLLKDLYARLLYGIKFKADNEECIREIHYIKDENVYIREYQNLPYWIENIKPYLRPMSSMTEEEKEELKSKCIHTETEEDWEGVRCDVWGIQILDKYDTRRWDNPIWPSTINMDAIDWLNARHFDYRGLIEKGLALEAPEEMYKF